MAANPGIPQSSGKQRTLNAPEVFGLWLIFSIVILAVIPDRFQSLPFDVLGFRIARNVVALLTLVFGASALAARFRQFLSPSSRLVGRTRFAVIAPVVFWILILGDSLVRPNVFQPNKLVQLGIVLVGISVLVAQRHRQALPNFVPALVIGFVLAVNWSDQILREVSYGDGTNVRFAWFLALSMLWLIPKKSKYFSWGLFLLNHAISWLALIFLLQTELRSPSFVALIVVAAQTFFWGLGMVDRICLSFLQLAFGTLAWVQLVQRPVFTDGVLQDSGRRNLLSHTPATSTHFDPLALFFGSGLGQTRLLVEAKTGTTPHNIWAEIFFDSGLFGFVGLATIIICLLFHAHWGSPKGSLSHEVMFLLLALFSFAFLGYFNSILEETALSIVVLIFIFFRVKPVGTRRQAPPPRHFS